MPNNTDFLEQLSQKELLDFGQQINIQDMGTDGDRLFPNRKTNYLEAEYMRLSKSPALPRAAMVHGFDTEAAIGKRPTAELVRTEQLLIKEKLSLSERVMRLRNRGVQNNNAILEYIYDDLGNLARAVRTRTEVAKFEAFCTGKMRIVENNVNLEIDYDVPDTNRYNLNWSAVDADIIGDIRRIVTAGKRLGQRYNRAMCSQKIMDILTQNTAIQKAVNGVLMQGVMVTQDGVNALFNRMFGFTIDVNDDWYEYSKADGSDVQARLFDENKFILYVGDNNGAVGTGLWGVTPEELDTNGFDASGSDYNGLIYLARWTTPDPVTRWVKASGVFIPVLPNPKGHVIITVADGTATLRDIDVNTEPSETAADSTVVDIYPATPASGNSYVYKAAASYQKVSVGDDLTGWTAISNGDTIAVTGKTVDKLTVAEIDSNNKAVGVGKAVIYKSASAT